MASINFIGFLHWEYTFLEDMKPYLNVFSEAQPEQFPELFDMMHSHRERVQSQIQDLQQILDFIDSKLKEGIQANRVCRA
ncbi:hypothetical protein ACFO4N_11255 [Camelliibacillus cellulosilyticus]|uniref:Uncharacterized protein n=1 Tax=Camelliibacillus cellulosilyticus TaxID=2174486 RepID=A0ABV9GPY5_9BACL